MQLSGGGRCSTHKGESFAIIKDSLYKVNPLFAQFLRRLKRYAPAAQARSLVASPLPETGMTSPK